MGPILVVNKTYTVAQCNLNGFAEANNNGESPENSYKHALFIALNYCSFGEQHATALGQMHEICNGPNQNNTIPEKMMDEYNNARGIDIAKLVGCSSMSDLSNACIIAYNTGVLHDVNGQPTP